MIWLGFRHIDDIIPTGFSMAHFGMPVLVSFRKNSTASALSLSLSGNRSLYSGFIHLFPVTVRKVHGGKAIIRSQDFDWITSNTSCWKCHSGCPPEQGRISQLKASWPRFRNSRQTAWLSSHARRTFKRARSKGWQRLFPRQ